MATASPAPDKLRIVLHDYSGHPPQVCLSRALARQGHEVLHLFSRDFETPRGALTRSADDPSTFHLDSVPTHGKFRKHSMIVRQLQEWGYGFNLTRKTLAFRPDVVVCSNTPVVPILRLQNACRRRGIAFLFWVMDVNSVAIASVFRDRISGIGPLISSFYDWLEGYELRRSDEVVLISEGFRDIVRDWKVADERVAVMPLWSALDEVRPTEKRNAWTERHGLAETTNLIYSGTLGFKHNPELLVGLAEAVRDRPNARVIVISEGIGARYLQEERTKRGLANLILLPYEPFDRLPQVLGGADVLLALLEPAAGTYSTPGKVLTHLCAGRTQVAAVPPENRACKVINESGGGLTCKSGDMAGFVAAVTELVNDPGRRLAMGKSARAYAEREFDIDRLAREFDSYIGRAIAHRAQDAGTGGPEPRANRGED